MVNTEKIVKSRVANALIMKFVIQLWDVVIPVLVFVVKLVRIFFLQFKKIKNYILDAEQQRSERSIKIGFSAIGLILLSFLLFTLVIYYRRKYQKEREPDFASVA